MSAHGQNRFYAFVNGGMDPSANTWLHEQDILAFNNTLFKGSPTVLLNASGPDTQYADTDGNGNVLRRPDGMTVLQKTMVGKSALPAKLNDVRTLHSTVTKQNPDTAVIVYGDHGDRAGLSLWREDLTAAEHFKLQSSISSKTLLRSIYIQCFAGSLLVDQSRQIPKDGDKLLPFLETYYPPNKCGLALSRHDEMGQYNTKDGPWQNSPWTNYFTNARPPNLSDLQNFLNQDQGLAPTTVLTSDYLLDDLATFYCQISDTSKKNDQQCQSSLAEPMSAALNNDPTAKLVVDPSFASALIVMRNIFCTVW